MKKVDNIILVQLKSSLYYLKYLNGERKPTTSAVAIMLIRCIASGKEMPTKVIYYFLLGHVDKTPTNKWHSDLGE